MAEMARHPQAFGVCEDHDGDQGSAWPGHGTRIGGGESSAFWCFISEQSRHRLPNPVSRVVLTLPCPPPPQGSDGPGSLLQRQGPSYVQSAPARLVSVHRPCSHCLCPSPGASLPEGWLFLFEWSFCAGPEGGM